jgi:hypothetical protein
MESGDSRYMSAKQWAVLLTGIFGLTVITLAVTGIEFVPPHYPPNPDGPPPTNVTNSVVTPPARPMDGVALEPGETPVFEVEVAVVPREKNPSVHDLEFTVTEKHGWYVENIYVDLFHRVVNEDSGEWERDDSKVDVPYKGFLINEVLPFNGIARGRTQPLLGVEWNLNSIGTSDEWEAVVFHHGLVVKPGPPRHHSADDDSGS